MKNSFMIFFLPLYSTFIETISAIGELPIKAKAFLALGFGLTNTKASKTKSEVVLFSSYFS